MKDRKNLIIALVLFTVVIIPITFLLKKFFLITKRIKKNKFIYKIPVRNQISKYVSSAPFKAVEKRVGDFCIVVPQKWSFQLNEPFLNYQNAILRLQDSDYPLILFQSKKTDEKALDFPSLKKELDQTCNLEALQKSFISPETSEEVPIENFTNSEFKTPHGLAYKVSFSFTFPQTIELEKALGTIKTFPLNITDKNITIQQFIYILQIDGYTIQLNASSPCKMDLEKISDYIIKTFTLNN